MATAAIPPALKAADIARFAQRAGQVEKAKPVVAYWCKIMFFLPLAISDLDQATIGLSNRSCRKAFTKQMMKA